MISKNKIKLIHSLETKKGREKAGLFVAEGPKVVNDLLHAGFTAENIFEDIEDIKKISYLQHPQSMLGVFKLPRNEHYTEFPITQLVLALDGVQDPGNLGTIIRVADWFGIKDIFCSLDTADCWNPKVVQATMGSIARVQLHYVDLNISFVSDAFLSRKNTLTGEILDFLKDSLLRPLANGGAFNQAVFEIEKKNQKQNRLLMSFFELFQNRIELHLQI